jgi:hypothetical protein
MGAIAFLERGRCGRFIRAAISDFSRSKSARRCRKSAAKAGRSRCDSLKAGLNSSATATERSQKSSRARRRATCPESAAALSAKNLDSALWELSNPRLRTDTLVSKTQVWRHAGSALPADHPDDCAQTGSFEHRRPSSSAMRRCCPIAFRPPRGRPRFLPV